MSTSGCMGAGEKVITVIELNSECGLAQMDGWEDGSGWGVDTFWRQKQIDLVMRCVRQMREREELQMTPEFLPQGR